MNKLGFYSKNDDVQTPKDFYESLNETYHFDFDPCPFKSDWDGLALLDWGKSNFVNPPFSKNKHFLKKAVEEMQKGNMSIFLLPIRSNSKYWQELVFPFATDFFFLKGMNFIGYEREMPVSLCLVEFDPKKEPKFTSGNCGDLQRCFWN